MNEKTATSNQQTQLVQVWEQKLGGISEIQLTLRIPNAYRKAIEAMCQTGEFSSKDMQEYCNEAVMRSFTALFHDAALGRYFERRIAAAALAHLKDIEQRLPEGVEDILIDEIWKKRDENSN